MTRKQKALTVSIIIPAYNEEDYLKGCLDSIARQSVRPLEVIVVDNNSTDRTVEIARRYDFVKVVHESRQHQAYAQAKGFGAACGDIIGRIDADTVLPSDWVAQLQAFFADSPQTIGVTGGGQPYDFLLKKPAVFVLNKFYILAYHLAGHTMMYGSNCAFRRQAWPKITSRLHLRADIWEDYDLAFCLGRVGSIKRLKNIDVQTSLRAVRRPILFQMSYQFRAVRTFWLNKGLMRAVVFFLGWSSLLLLVPFVLFDKYASLFLLRVKDIKSIPKIIPEGEK